jgi:D-3-phosphoglycerate dehydrogenase
MKFLIAGDSHIKPSIVESCLRDTLRPIRKDLEIELIEWGFNEDYYDAPPIASDPGLKEYAGSPEKLSSLVRDVDVLVVHMAPVTSSVLRAGNRLKIVGCCRGGPVNVNVKAATSRKIPVLFTPGRNADTVADYAIGMIIAESRSIARAHADLKKGVWRGIDLMNYDNAGFELAGKSLGIVGIGNIGLKVAERAKAFGMKILAYDPYVTRERIEGAGLRSVDLVTLFSQADFVTIHARATPETKGMIGKKLLSLMKETSYLINTARGDLVDEVALYEILKTRRIAGAGIDVFQIEPLRLDSPILTLDNVTVTPHIAGASREAVHRAAQMIADDIGRVLIGNKPLHCANPEAL